MTVDEPILCGVDGSPGSRRAALSASALSRALGCSLQLVHVVPPRPPMTPAAVLVGGHPITSAHMAELDRAESDAAFSSVADVAGSAAAERITAHGPAADRLSALAASLGARFIVVGTRGMGPARSALLGSVSQELAAQASRPVVIVGPRDAAPVTLLGPGPVVCGTDGSAAAHDAERVAARLADDLQVALTLVSVRAPDARIEALGSGLAERDPGSPPPEHVERASPVGEPAQALARAAAERRAALLVVGSRGRGSVRAALLGSVSSAVVRHADCAVVVPPGAAGATA